jgi:hypothetical protein
VTSSTRRSSEQEPADSHGDKWNVIGGWLLSLTLAFYNPEAGIQDRIITTQFRQDNRMTG